MRLREPPRIAVWILKHFGRSPATDAILGDMQERYQQGKTAVWYWRQTFIALLTSGFWKLQENDRLVFRTTIPVLRTISVTKLRNFILAGLGLCVLALAYLAFFGPGLGRSFPRDPRFLSLIVLILVWNAYAAIHRIHDEDSMVLNDGVKWGLAVGCAWLVVALVPINVFAPKDELGAPLWFLGLFSVVLLPFAAGAAGAIKTGKVRVGIRVGFWSGVVSGLLGFLIVLSLGSLRFAFMLGWRGQSFAISRILEPALLSSLWIMVFLGTLYGVVAGAIGGWGGLKLYRTGEPPISAAPAPVFTEK
jgi:hypothetical protein